MAKKSICLVVPSEYASDYYRAVLPHRHCRGPLMERHGINLVIPEDWTRPGDHDAYVWYRAPSAEVFPMVTSMVLRDKRIAWDLDDHYWSIPPDRTKKWGEDNRFQFILNQCLAVSTRVSVSTGPLADVVRTKTETATTVLPNLLDPADYRERVRHHRVATVLWQGSRDRDEDLEVLRPALIYLRREVPAVRLIIASETCPAWLREVGAIHLKGWPMRNHAEALDLLSPDVGLAPISDAPASVEFNRCKSAIKMHEYLACGAKVVASTGFAYGDGVGLVAGGAVTLANAATWPDALANTVHKGMLFYREPVFLDGSTWTEANAEPWVEWFASLVA